MSDETVDLQAYNDFMCWEDTQDNMDQSLFHFFPELELEPTFSRVMTGLDTRTHLIPAGLQPTDIMITGTTHDPASIFGEDFVTEETLIDIPAINTLPVTKIQSRKIFCDTLTQKPSYIVLHVVEPITRETTAVLKSGIALTQETKPHNIEMPSKSYALTSYYTVEPTKAEVVRL